MIRCERPARYLIGAALAAVFVAALVLALLPGSDEQGGSERADRGFAARRALPATKLTDLNAAARTAGCRLRRHPSEGREHVQGPVRYRTNPPTSGAHDPVAAEDGVYAQAPPTEPLVHSLEHGRVIVQY